MHAASTILLLLFMTTLCGPLTRVIRLPLPLLQIGMGVTASLLGMKAQIDPAVFMLLFIPPLLFSDAFLMPSRELREMRGVILGLAIGLVLFATVTCGLFVHWLIPPLPLAACFALAAVLSPTDAVAVSGMLEGSGAPRRLLHVLAGEAMLNDATGLVTFKFASAAALSGSFSFLHAGGAFVVVSLVGAAVGIGAALCLTTVQRWLIRRGFDHGHTFITASILLPFASYVAAEHLGGSGILAAVAAGLTARRGGLHVMLQTETRLGLSSIWSMLTFVLNGMVFVLLGLQLPSIVQGGIALMHRVHVPLWRLPLSVVQITLALVVIRLVWIGGAALVRRLPRRPVVSSRSSGSAANRSTEPRNELRIGRQLLRLVVAMAVAGVRGAITLAAVLSLDEGFPARNLLVTLAAGVILCSLLLAAMLLPPLLAGVTTNPIDPHEREVDRARLAMTGTAIDALKTEIGGADTEHRAVLEALLDETLTKQRRLQLAAEDAPEEERNQQVETFRRQRLEVAIRLRMLRAERESLDRMNRDSAINDEVELTLMRELDHQEEVVLATARWLPRSLPRDHAGHPEHDAHRAGFDHEPDGTGKPD